MAQKNTQPSVPLDLRTILRWTVTAVSVLWVVLTVYTEFIAADPDQYSFRSAEVQARRNVCGGDYRRRSECTDLAMDAEQGKGFLVWIGKAFLVLGPPIVLGALLRFAYRDKPEDDDNYFGRTPPPIKRRRVR